MDRLGQGRLATWGKQADDQFGEQRRWNRHRDLRGKAAVGADGQWSVAGCGRGESVDTATGSAGYVWPSRERVIWLV